MSPEKSLLHPLTALRFFAAILIVLHHSQALFGDRFAPTSIVMIQGVSFFFVLSGFILAYNYPALKSRESVLMFYVARFARIWPLHVAIALAILVFSSQVVSSAAPVLLNLLLLQAWVPLKEYFFSLNAVSWSLSVELFFYALFPVLIWRWKETWHWKLLVAACMVLTMITIGNVLQLPDWNRLTSGVGMDAITYINPMVRLFEFVLGIAMASLYRFAMKGDVPWTRAQATLVEIGMIALAMLTLRLCNSANETQWLGQGGALYLSHQGGMFVWAAMILVFAFERGWVSKILSTRIAVLLGEISFALYMVHPIILSRFTARKPPVDAHPVLCFCAYLLICLAVSYLCFVVIEKPVRALILSWAKRRMSD